jgi:hypothetical protein
MNNKVSNKIKLTKVQAIVKLIKAKGGSATWKEIYDGIEKYFPKAKASKWKEFEALCIVKLGTVAALLLETE